MNNDNTFDWEAELELVNKSERTEEVKELLSNMKCVDCAEDSSLLEDLNKYIETGTIFN